MIAARSSATAASNRSLMTAPLGGVGDHGADAFIGIDLEQQGVGNRAVEYVCASYATPQRAHARCNLRDHPALEFVVDDHRLGLARREHADERGLVGEVCVEAIDIGEEDDLLGA